MILAIFCLYRAGVSSSEKHLDFNLHFLYLTVLGLRHVVQRLSGTYVLFSEVKELDFFLTFYLIGCASNLFCSFRFHKILVILCIALTAVLYIELIFCIQQE